MGVTLGNLRSFMLPILDRLGITTGGVYTPPSSGVANPMTATLDAGGYGLTNLLSIVGKGAGSSTMTVTGEAGGSGVAGQTVSLVGGTGNGGGGTGAILSVRGGTAGGGAGTISAVGDTTVTGTLLATNFTAWTDVAATDTWSNATTNIRWRQIGKKVEAYVLTTCTGTPASAGYSFTLPGSMPAVDTTNIGGNISLIGHMTYYDASAGFYTGLVYYNGTDCYCYVNSGSWITTLLTEASPATVANGDKVMSIISYPCT